MKLLLMTFAAFTVLIFTYPHLDITIASHFYNEATGFHGKHDGLLGVVYHGTRILTVLMVLAFLTLLGLLYKKKKQYGAFGKRELIFLLASLTAGPGIVVNAIFKEHWGRARPGYITEFGGEAQFTPPLLIADQCESNCSFAAGHPSVGFFFFAFAFVFPYYKNSITFGAIVAGLAIGLVRIMQGGHFFSDVIYSGLFTFLATYLMYYLILKPYRKHP